MFHWRIGNGSGVAIDAFTISQTLGNFLSGSKPENFILTTLSLLTAAIMAKENSAKPLVFRRRP